MKDAAVGNIRCVMPSGGLTSCLSAASSFSSDACSASALPAVTVLLASAAHLQHTTAHANESGETCLLLQLRHWLLADALTPGGG